MLHLPSRFAAVILSFAPLLIQRSWQHAQVLLIGSILAPGKRTVTSLLQISGLAQERRFVNDHRVLNRTVWSPRAASCLLLAQLIAAFAPDGCQRRLNRGSPAFSVLLLGVMRSIGREHGGAENPRARTWCA
jgi:hypothetical protein